jgi:hypothetical protein
MEWEVDNLGLACCGVANGALHLELLATAVNSRIEGTCY